MKKLVTTTGGHPLQLDDINLMQTAYTEVFTAVAESLTKGYGTTGVYLYGCSPTIISGAAAITAGAIYYNGNTYQVDTQTLPVLSGSDVYFFQIIQTPLPPSPVTYQNSTSQNVHIRETMVLVASTATPLSSIHKSQILTMNQISGPPQFTVVSYNGDIANFDSGTRLGLAGTQVHGWGICDGATFYLQTGGQITSKDLTGKTLVGYNSVDTDYNAIDTDGRTNAAGGNKTHTLSISEIPTHQHYLESGTTNASQIGFTSIPNGDTTVSGQSVVTTNAFTARDIIPTSDTHFATTSGHVIGGILNYPGQTALDLKNPYATVLYIIKLY